MFLRITARGINSEPIPIQINSNNNINNITIMTIINNINNNSIISFFDMIANHLAQPLVLDGIFVVIGIIIVMSILDDLIPFAFDVYEYVIEPRLLRLMWSNNNNNNSNSNRGNGNNNNRRSDISGSSNYYHLHRVSEVEPLNSHASSIRHVLNNNNNNINNNSSDNDTSYYYMPPHHLRQTIESTGLHNMPRRNARLVPPKETRNHRRPPLHPDIFYADSDSTTDTLSTDAPATTNEDDDTTIDITAPSLLSINTSHGGEVDDDIEDDDEDSIDNLHYFLLPADFESTTAVATITRSHREDEVDAVSFAYSESTVIGEEWCDEVGWELINEESNELFGVPLAPAQEEEVVVVAVEELPQELLSEVEAVDDGTAEMELFAATGECNHDVEAVAEEEEEVLEEEAHVDEGGEEVTTVLLGSIWVKHPKYTCMVRRSSRVLLMMSVK